VRKHYVLFRELCLVIGALCIVTGCKPGCRRGTVLKGESCLPSPKSSTEIGAAGVGSTLPAGAGAAAVSNGSAPSVEGEAGTVPAQAAHVASASSGTMTSPAPAGVPQGGSMSTPEPPTTAPMPSAGAGTPICGDGVVEVPELCDVDCPNGCDDKDPCTRDTMSGSAVLCNAQCTFEAITAAQSGDQCCPVGADATSDNDCKSMCGNGVVEPSELCDGDCPDRCDDLDECTASKLVGSAAGCNAECISEPITLPVRNDGCCPPGANADIDNDCTPECGNRVIEPGEICDGNCPTACPSADACNIGMIVGSTATCNAVCTNTPILSARSGDGCCPFRANANTDSDCIQRCGNGVIEGSEICEGDCPTSCTDPDVCTDAVLQGSPSNCTSKCVNVPKRANTVKDGCCPPGTTNANVDGDCEPKCGNGLKEQNEECGCSQRECPSGTIHCPSGC
jgi:hypothetical protein